MKHLNVFPSILLLLQIKCSNLEPVSSNVSYDDLRGSHGLSSQEVDQANGSSTAHQHGLPEADASPLASVNAHRQRLHERSLLQGHVFRQLEAEVRRVLVVSAQVPIIRWHCTELKYIFTFGTALAKLDADCV